MDYQPCFAFSASYPSPLGVFVPPLFIIPASRNFVICHGDNKLRPGFVGIRSIGVYIYQDNNNHNKASSHPRSLIMNANPSNSKMQPKKLFKQPIIFKPRIQKLLICTLAFMHAQIMHVSLSFIKNLLVSLFELLRCPSRRIQWAYRGIASSWMALAATEKANAVAPVVVSADFVKKMSKAEGTINLSFREMFNWFDAPSGSLAVGSKEWIQNMMELINDRVRYQLDLWLEIDRKAYLLILVGVTLFWVLFGALIWFFTTRSVNRSKMSKLPPFGTGKAAEKPKDLPYWEALWKSWSCLASSSTHTKEKGLQNRLISLTITVGGLASYSIMTAAFSAAMKERFEVLRHGQLVHPVLERDHVVVVGCNSHLFALLKELDDSHEFALRERRGTAKKLKVVLLNDGYSESTKAIRDKVLAKAEAGALPRLVILSRRGSGSDSNTYKLVSADKARQVIILADDAKGSHSSDSHVVTSVLALQNAADGADAIVEVSKSSTGSLLKSLQVKSSKTSTSRLLVDDRETKAKRTKNGIRVTPVVQAIAPKLFVRCARRRGLASVYSELLSHSGTVINVREYGSSLAGLFFRDLIGSFPNSVVCGIIRSDGQVMFRPPEDYVLSITDRVMIMGKKRSNLVPPIELERLAEDRRASLKMTKKIPQEEPNLVEAFSRDFDSRKRKQHLHRMSRQFPQEFILMSGWNRESAEALIELDKYVGPGSQVVVISGVREEYRLDLITRKLRREGNAKLQNLKVRHIVGNPLSRTDLSEALSLREKEFGIGNRHGTKNSVMVLPEASWKDQGNGRNSTDHHSVMAALLCEQICAEFGVRLDSIAAKLEEGKLCAQLSISHPQIEFVSLSELMGLFTAQVCEHRYMNWVWSDLLTSDGWEISIKPVSKYAAVFQRKMDPLGVGIIPSGAPKSAAEDSGLPKAGAGIGTASSSAAVAQSQSSVPSTPSSGSGITSSATSPVPIAIAPNQIPTPSSTTTNAAFRVQPVQFSKVIEYGLKRNEIVIGMYKPPSSLYPRGELTLNPESDMQIQLTDFIVVISE